MFDLADPGRTRSVLASAGFTDVTINPAAERILLGGGGTLDDAVEFVRRGGMGRAVLASADAAADIAVAAVRAALAPFRWRGRGADRRCRLAGERPAALSRFLAGQA